MRGFVTVTSDRSGLQLHRLAQHSQWRHGACPISLFHFNFGRFLPTGKLVALSEAQVLFLDPHVHHLSAMGASATLSFFLPLRDFVKVAQSHQFATRHREVQKPGIKLRFLKINVVLSDP